MVIALPIRVRDVRSPQDHLNSRDISARVAMKRLAVRDSAVPMPRKAPSSRISIRSDPPLSNLSAKERSDAKRRAVLVDDRITVAFLIAPLRFSCVEMQSS